MTIGMGSVKTPVANRGQGVLFVMRTRLLAPLALILVLVPWVEVCLAQSPAASTPSGTKTFDSEIANTEAAISYEHNYGLINVVKGAQIRAREAEARGVHLVRETPNAER